MVNFLSSRRRKTQTSEFVTQPKTVGVGRPSDSLNKIAAYISEVACAKPSSTVQFLASTTQKTGDLISRILGSLLNK